MTMAFEYLEIRPCIHIKDGTISCRSAEEFNSECYFFTEVGTPYTTSWTLYGRYADEAGQFLAMAIGDFSTKEDAFSVMDAIIAPMAKARDIIDAGSPHTEISPSRDRLRASSAVLEDFINQSSSHERL